MRRLSIVAVALAMTAAAAGCGSGSGSGSGGGTTDAGSGAGSSTTAATTAPVPSTAPGTTVAPTSVSLRVTDVHLTNSEESDNGMRILLPAGVATASVTLTGVPSPNRVISVCQATELDRRMTSAVCRMPAGGEAVTVALGATASGIEIVQAGVSGSGAAGNSTTLDEVTIRYAASSREVGVRLPQIAAGDAGGRPTFALTPPSTTGTYRAGLTWTVIQVFGGTPSTGQLELVQGGTPIKHADSSGLDVRLSGDVPAPVGDAAVRVSNIGSGAMVTPKLTLLLP